MTTTRRRTPSIPTTLRGPALGLLGALVFTAPAIAATARLAVPQGGVMKSSPDAEITFRLGSGWKLVHGFEENTPAIGEYQRTVQLGNDTPCIQHFDAYGVTLRTRERPVLRGRFLRVPSPATWRMGHVAVTSQVQTSRRSSFILVSTPGLTIVYGHGHNAVSRLLTGVSVLRTPAWLAPRDRVFTVVRFEIQGSVEGLPAPNRVPTSARVQACNRYTISHGQNLLRQVLSTVRVQRRG